MQNQGQLLWEVHESMGINIYIKNIKSKLWNQNHYEINELVREEKWIISDS